MKSTQEIIDANMKSNGVPYFAFTVSNHHNGHYQLIEDGTIGEVIDCPCDLFSREITQMLTNLSSLTNGLFLIQGIKELEKISDHLSITGARVFNLNRLFGMKLGLSKAYFKYRYFSKDVARVIRKLKGIDVQQRNLITEVENFRASIDEEVKRLQSVVNQFEESTQRSANKGNHLIDTFIDGKASSDLLEPFLNMVDDNFCFQPTVKDVSETLVGLYSSINAKLSTMLHALHDSQIKIKELSISFDYCSSALSYEFHSFPLRSSSKNFKLLTSESSLLFPVLVFINHFENTLSTVIEINKNISREYSGIDTSVVLAHSIITPKVIENIKSNLAQVSIERMSEEQLKCDIDNQN